MIPGDSDVHTPAQPGSRRPSKTLAIVALGLAIVPLGITWVAAIVLAVVVFVRVEKEQARGRGLAIAAVIIAALWIALIEAMLVAGVVEAQYPAHYWGTGIEDKRPVSREVNNAEVKVGDCLTKLPNEDFETLTTIPCFLAHRAEVYALFDAAVDPKSTQDEVDRRADRGCLARYRHYVGIDYESSKFKLFYMSPAARTLTLDDGVICVVTDGVKPIRGSLKNARR